MLTVMVHAKIKQECLEEYIEIASLLTKETRDKRAGCISYSFCQRVDEPTEFVLFEQWENQAALAEHIKQLVVLFGAPSPGGILPEKLINMYERGIPYYYNEIS